MPRGVITLKVLHISVLIDKYINTEVSTYPYTKYPLLTDAQTDAHFVRIDITVINPNLT